MADQTKMIAKASSNEYAIDIIELALSDERHTSPSRGRRRSIVIKHRPRLRCTCLLPAVLRPTVPCVGIVLSNPAVVPNCPLGVVPLRVATRIETYEACRWHDVWEEGLYSPDNPILVKSPSRTNSKFTVGRQIEFATGTEYSDQHLGFSHRDVSSSE